MAESEPTVNPTNNRPEEESRASMIENLILNLFGAVQKTINNGRATWTTPCSVNDNVGGFARAENEGLVCYILRILENTVGGLVSRYQGRSTSIATTLTGTDTVLRCTNNVPIAITVTNQGALDDDKFFKVKMAGTGSVTITPDADTINGQATFVLDTQGSSLEFWSPKNGNWEIL